MEDGKDLQKAAQDYILYSNGDIKLVIGIDINYGGRKSTVSLWRPPYTRRDDEEYEVLEARQDIAYKVRRVFTSYNPSLTLVALSVHGWIAHQYY